MSLGIGAVASTYPTEIVARLHAQPWFQHHFWVRFLNIKDAAERLWDILKWRYYVSFIMAHWSLLVSKVCLTSHITFYNPWCGCTSHIDAHNRTLKLGIAITEVAQEQREARSLSWPPHALHFDFWHFPDFAFSPRWKQNQLKQHFHSKPDAFFRNIRHKRSDITCPSERQKGRQMLTRP